MTSVQTISGTPSRTSRSRAKDRGPLRDTEPGVRRPEIKKKRPITNKAAGITTIDSARSLTLPSWTSWTSWYGHALSRLPYASAPWPAMITATISSLRLSR